jgi:hypothetical protein
MASNILFARPEWKKSSPINKNIGIGTIANIAILAKALSVSCPMLAATLASKLSNLP